MLIKRRKLFAKRNERSIAMWSRDVRIESLDFAEYLMGAEVHAHNVKSKHYQRGFIKAQFSIASGFPVGSWWLVSRVE